MKSLLVVLLIFTLLNRPNEALLTIKSKFLKAGIIPSILNGIDIPNQLLRVDYNGKKVELGNEFSPKEVKDEPTVSWNAKPGSFYTLVMIDPDAPTMTDPKLGQVKHWLVANIPGSDVSNGDHITEYLGSRPPRNTLLHRYIFIAYEQPEELDFMDEPRTIGTSRANRFHFSVRHFAAMHDLGRPVAVNFFLAKWDEFVDEQNQIDMKRIQEEKKNM